MRSGLTRLGCWLILHAVIASIICPSVVPPGNVWTLGHSIACILVVVGAFHTAKSYGNYVIFLLYGCMAGGMIMPVLLPDSRDAIAIGSGRESIDEYLWRAGAFVSVMSVICVIAASFRHRLERARHRDPNRCRKCAYLLHGLPEPRCPECGTPFVRD